VSGAGTSASVFPEGETVEVAAGPSKDVLSANYHLVPNNTVVVTGAASSGNGGGNAGDGGGLAITGPDTAVIGGAGLALVLGGSAAYVLLRRRGTRFVG
jgi:hypothetical protein